MVVSILLVVVIVIGAVCWYKRYPHSSGLQLIITYDDVLFRVKTFHNINLKTICLSM